MPDLNLLDDETTFEESAEEKNDSQPPPQKLKKQSGGGKGLSLVVFVILILAIIGGGLFYLNKRGIIHLGKKNPPAVAQLQEEQLPPSAPVAQPAAEQPKIDTPAQVALLDTTPKPVAHHAAAEKKSVPLPPVVQVPTTVTPSDGGVSLPEKKKGKAERHKTAIAEEPKIEKHEESSVGDSQIEPKRPSVAEGNYTIQVIVYSNQRQASEIVSNLKSAGYHAFVERVLSGKAHGYAVRIGRYVSREAAAKSAKSFPEQLRANYVIAKVGK